MEANIAALSEIIILFVVLVLTLYGVALGYHWYSYGASKQAAFKAVTIYTIGSIVLILGLVISATFF